MTGIGLKPNASLPSGADTDGRVYAAMVARARALIPRLRDRATRTEELRRLPSETERDRNRSFARANDGGRGH